VADKVYKKVRVVGCSAQSIDHAVTLAVTQAARSLRGVAWFEVAEIRGAVQDGRPAEWQVTVDLGFKLE
jgi:flavin-binding protein dodecin